MTPVLASAALFHRKPLSPAQRASLAELLDIALVPAWSDDRAARLAAPTEPPPVPLLPPLGMVAPLLVHHALLAGLEPATLFRAERPMSVPDQEELNRLAFGFHKRRRVLGVLFRAFERHGVRDAMLVKGESVATRFDSPAMRVMADTDVVIGRSRGAVRRAEAALRESEFARGPANAPGVWVHDASGATVDLLRPAHAFGARTANGAVACLEASWPAIVREPRVADHLVVVALHAARHHGGRIWRDVLDVRALTRDRDARSDFAEALKSARAAGLAPAVEALFAFAGEVCTDLPKSRPRTRQGRGILELYRALAWLPYPPHALKLLRRALVEGASFGELARRLKRDREPGGDEGWSEPEFGLGRVPARFVERQMFKLGLAGGLLLSGRMGETRRLLERQSLAQACAPKLFRPVANEDGPE